MKTMNHKTSKQPNPSKFHHNNRFLIPFHRTKIKGEKKALAVVTDRVPGAVLKSSDPRWQYRIQQNGALVKEAAL